MFQDSFEISGVPVKIECRGEEPPKSVVDDVKRYVKGKWQLDTAKKCLDWTRKWNRLHGKVAEGKLDAAEYYRDCGELLEWKRTNDTPELPFRTFFDLHDDFTDKYGESYRVWIQVGEPVETAERLTIVEAYRKLGLKSKFSDETIKHIIARDKSPSREYSSPQEYKQHLETIDLQRDVENVAAMTDALKNVLEERFPLERFTTDTGQGLRHSILESLEEIRRDYEKQARDPTLLDVATSSFSGDARLMRHLQEIANFACDSWKWEI